MEILQYLIDIIRTEMNLTSEQVLIYNQKWTIPPDEKVRIFLSLISSAPYGAKTNYIQGTGGLREEIVLNKMELIGIDIYSRGVEALYKKDQIILALNSTYAQQQMEKYSFKISRLPTTFTDLSFLETSAILYRFHNTINVYSAVKKEKDVDYFDAYSYELTTNK